MNKLEKLKELRDRIENNKKVEKVKYALVGVSVSLAIFLVATPSIIAHYRKKMSEENNLDLLNSYNQYIQNYANQFDKDELEDLDIFVKIMYDSMKDGSKYKKVDEVPFGYERLFLYDNKFGDCANYSDDMTAKLNAINSDYHARNLYVNMQDGNLEENLIDPIDKFIRKYIVNANHCVTVVDIDDKVVVIDPTNYAIGTIKNGQIVMFSDDLSMKVSPIYTYFGRGMDDFFALGDTIIKSFHNKEEIDDLNNAYGEEAQGKSLEKMLHYKVIKNK